MHIPNKIKRLITDIGFYITGGRIFKKSPPSKLLIEKIKSDIMQPSSGVTKYVPHARLSFSQNGEDLLLQRIFEPKKTPGFYIDIGAHHPMLWSNTCLLHRAGWRGINIEPNFDLYTLFNQYRPNDINLNLGVAKKSGELLYYMFREPAYNTFSAGWNTHVQKNYSPDFLLETRKIAVEPLATILSKKLPLNTVIDFMNVDCEEFDYEVLESNDWQQYRPKVLAVECNAHLEKFYIHAAVQKNALLARECVCNFLKTVGYKKHFNSFNTYFFADDTITNFLAEVM